ncbi:DUF4337 family protein [Lichenicoccus roseus]|uniref:DUF4337 domain-containing protein n=1 Tax=Lichenicoccus roseus TaxID=2683649 RepID=A0A5R9JAQ0_9PROT|nr:DUF4337 family protein [Lichenicoccus roseus]TLU72446.1 DUF4337 domain-containing protein [Lichenicoccus roseus]
MEQQLEHHEHAGHAAEHGNKHAALLVAVLAACLAISEQGAKHAEIRVNENSIAAADAWTQYQGKSIRQALAHDLAALGATLDPPQTPQGAAARRSVLEQLAEEQSHYERDPGDGKQAVAARAHHFEAERDLAMQRTHSYDNAAAALELAIVLATVSVIASSRMLLAASMALGAIGLALTLLGWLAPSYGSF